MKNQVDRALALIPFAQTDKQIEVVKAVAKHRTFAKAADNLGLNASTVGQFFRTVEKYAARRGLSPEHDMTKAVPEGYGVKGVSSLYGADGELKVQWVKSEVDLLKQREMLQEAFAGLSEGLRPAKPRKGPKSAPDSAREALSNLFVLSDVHLGMMAWAPEAGEDWDLDKGVDAVNGAWVDLVQRAPKANKAVICILGDYFHSDGLESVTPTSGHVVDSSARYGRIVREGVKLIRNICDRALKSHSEVELVIMEGNHDLMGSLWLRTMMAALYERETRLLVHEIENPFYSIRVGGNMLGFHHGHMKSMQTKGLSEVALLFSGQPEWQGADHRYIHSGHKHNFTVNSLPTCVVTQHPTLAPKDAYSARHGYDADRGMLCITYHDKCGQVATTVSTPGMF